MSKDSPGDGAQTIDEQRPAFIADLVESGDQPVDPEDAKTEVSCGPRFFGAEKLQQQEQQQEQSERLDVATASDCGIADICVTLAIDTSPRASIKQSGDATQGALQLDEESRQRAPSTEVTVQRRVLPQLNDECRLCGQKVIAPRRVRFARPTEHGYRCQRCGNVYCNAHTVRISGLFETLLWGARFSCPLCLGEGE